MSESPSLTLPSKAPGMEDYHNRPMQLLPFALYTLVEFTDEELNQLQQACESEIDCAPGTKVKFPAQSRNITGPLRAAFDYHVQLGKEGEYDSTYFIAATSLHWRVEGVLLVTLDDDDLECNVDSFRIRADTSGLSLINLQVGNTDWVDVKENYEIGNEDDDTSPDEDDNEETGDDERDGDNEGTVENTATITHEIPSQPPPVGFFIGVYAESETVGTALIRKIEPAANIKSADEFACQLQTAPSSPSSSLEDRITQACKYHPYRTQQTRHLHPNLFLLSSPQHTHEDEIILIHLDWPGSTNDLSMDQLFDIGSTVPRKTQRLEASAWMAVPILCDIASGRRKWSPEHWIFGIYTVHYPDADIKIAQLIDKRWSRRGHGEDRVAVGQTIPASLVNIGVDGRRTEHDGVVVPMKDHGVGGASMQIPSDEIYYAAVIEAHTALAYRYRFSRNFSRSYCIVAATTEPDAEGVLLVKINWEDDVGGKAEGQRNTERDELKGRWKEVISLLRCNKVGVAHKYLSEVADGKQEWEGVRLKDLLD